MKNLSSLREKDCQWHCIDYKQNIKENQNLIEKFLSYEI